MSLDDKPRRLEDHKRGCPMRYAECTCGYEAQIEREASLSHALPIRCVACAGADVRHALNLRPGVDASLYFCQRCYSCTEHAFDPEMVESRVRLLAELDAAKKALASAPSTTREPRYPLIAVPTEELTTEWADELWIRCCFSQEPPSKADFKTVFRRAVNMYAQWCAERTPPSARGRILMEADAYCPSCGHNRDKSATSSIDATQAYGMGYHYCQRCGAKWNEISPTDGGAKT